MTSLSWIKVAIAVIGIAIWSFGYRQDDATIRWVGIAVLAAAALLRFYPSRPGRGGPPQSV